MKNNAVKTALTCTCALTLLGGCASTRYTNPDDPWEGFNRGVFSFNEGMDKYLLKPVAQGYDFITPTPIQTGVTNFFGNLGDLRSFANNLLQGRLGDGMSDLMRFTFNSTFGIAGLLDIASEAGLQKQNNDFGRTLATWGVGEGPFIMVPFFGPRTTRDALTIPVDIYSYPVTYIDHIPTRTALAILNIVNTRTHALGMERTLEEATTDKYAFMRDFYLQQRRYRTSDGQFSLDYENFDTDETE